MIQPRLRFMPLMGGVTDQAALRPIVAGERITVRSGRSNGSIPLGLKPAELYISEIHVPAGAWQVHDVRVDGGNGCSVA